MAGTSISAALLLAVVATGAAAFRFDHHHHHGNNGVQVLSSASDLVIEVPAEEKRDPERCEPYETNDYMSTGCEQLCTVNGNFGMFALRDARSRRVATCKMAGSYCRAPVVSVSPLLNVTFTSGRCNEECQCVPRQPGESERVAVEQLLGSLLPKPRRAGDHHHHERRLHAFSRAGGEHAFGALKIRVPPASARNQTVCESYESFGAFGIGMNMNPYLESCHEMCTMRGNMGSLMFDGGVRQLAKQKRDGSVCTLATTEESDSQPAAVDFMGRPNHVRLVGVRSTGHGVCHGGVCKPKGWDKAQASISATSTTAPTSTSTTMSQETTAHPTKEASESQNKVNKHAYIVHIGSNAV